MSGGIAIARVFGIEVRISPAWSILVAVVTLVGAEQASVTAPGLAAPLAWLVGAAVALAFLVSVVAHELAHALVGRRHSVEASTVTLGFVAGMAPLSIQASSPGGELLIALSGPLLSLALAVLAFPAAILIGAAGGGFAAVGGGLLVVAGLNLVLGVLSLLPGLPLDGGRVVRALAWAGTGDRDRASRVTSRVGRLIGWVAVGIGVALALVDRVTEGLLVLCFGWLLASGARSLDRRLGLESLLRGASVEDATRHDVPQVGPQLTVDTFASRYEGEDAVTALPVVDDGRVLGVIGRRRLQRLGRRRYPATRAADIMATPPLAPFLAPGDSLWAAVELMNQQGFDGLAVVAAGRLEGMVTRESIGDVIRRRMGGPEPGAQAGGRA